jgi:HEAT repeat protein
LLQITAPVSPGSSGSPVLSSSGKVVGVVSFRLNAGESLNFATSAADVSKIINSASTKKSTEKKPVVRKAPVKEPQAPKLLVPNGNPRLEALARKLSDPATADEAARKLRLEGVKALPYLFAALPLQNDDYPESPSPDQLRVIETIVSNGTSAIPFALKYLGKDDNWNYINILELIGAPASPALCKQLQSKDYKVRRDVTWILASAGTKAAIPFLLKSLKDSDVIVRANAAGSLGRLGNTTGFTVLSGLLLDSRQEIRDHATTKLGLIDSAESVALLEKLALNPDRNVTLADVGYALQLVGKRGVPVLIRMLLSEELEVRRTSLWQFLESKNRGCSGALIPLLKDSDDWIRASAAQLLGEFKAEFAVKSLLEVLNDPEPSVRSSVAGALGEIGAKSAVEPLRKLLLTEKEEAVIEAITSALDELE